MWDIRQRAIVTSALLAWPKTLAVKMGKLEGTVRRATAWLIVVFVSLAVISSTFIVSVVAWRLDRKYVVDGSAEALPEPQQPGSYLQSDVKVFPLHTRRAALSEDVTPQTLVKELSDLGAELGLDARLPELAKAAVEQSVGSSDGSAYPYDYPELDQTVASELSAVAVADDPGLVLDYAAVAVTAAANAESHSGFKRIRAGGALAYSVLRRAVELIPTCELHLQLLYVVTLGDNAHDAAVTTEFERARQWCPNDSTPLWLRAQDRASRVYRAGPSSDLTSQKLLAGSFEDLNTLQREFPRSPLGYAGKADLLLDRADAVERRRTRPFQARQWRREALGLYRQARVVSDDPALLIGEARALSDLDRHEEAESTLARLPADLSKLSAVVTQRVRVRQATGDSQGVLDLVSTTAVDFPDGREVSNSASRLPGYGRLRSLATYVWDASFQVWGGADTEDAAFIPKSRDTYLTDGACLEQAARNALLLTGRGGATTWTSPEFETPMAAAGMSPCDDQELVPTDSEDTAQDLFRWAGDLVGAQKVVDAWIASQPDSYTAYQRAGEIAYLSGDWDDAVAEFKKAAVAWEESGDANRGATEWLEAIFPGTVISLQLAAAQKAGDDIPAAQRTLTELLRVLNGKSDLDDEGNSAHGDANYGSFYAESELGAAALAAGRDRDAVDHLSRSIQIASAADEDGFVDAEGDQVPVPLLRGAQESNLALALSRIGRHEEAIEMAWAARSRDPDNPIFLDTLAFSYDLAGELEAAVPAYEAALAADPTSYVSANNLAVIVGKTGDNARARSLLQGVVATAPTYGTGWHNLGVAEARSGLMNLLSSQSALGRGARLDRELRTVSADFIVDDAVYSSGLDISKPLPPTWNYASVASPTVSRFLFAMIVLAVLRAAWSLGLDRIFEAVTLRIMRAGQPRSWLRRILGLRIGLGVALATSVVVLSVSPVRWAPTWGEGGLLVAVVASLVLLPTAVRRQAMNTRALTAKEVASAPAAVLGLLAMIVGMTLAPYPGLADSGERQSRRIVWAPAAVVAAIALIFVALTVVSAVPFARVVAMAAVALGASVMLPIRPFDGALLSNRVIGVAVAAVSMIVIVAASAHWL